MVKYILCLVCGRMTPTDRGVCYHCGSPLPTEIRLPLGLIICPNCLKITPVDTGYCSHCRAPLPPDLVKAAKRELAKYRVRHGLNIYTSREKNIYDIMNPYSLNKQDMIIDEIKENFSPTSTRQINEKIPSLTVKAIRILRVKKLSVK